MDQPLPNLLDLAFQFLFLFVLCPFQARYLFFSSEHPARTIREVIKPILKNLLMGIFMELLCLFSWPNVRVLPQAA